MPRALTPVGHPRGIAGPGDPCPASDSFPARRVRGSCSKTMDGSRQVKTTFQDPCSARWGPLSFSFSLP
eukprot:scaffold17176_cov128-Isochrysis_galbana.AAC.1